MTSCGTEAHMTHSRRGGVGLIMGKWFPGAGVRKNLIIKTVRHSAVNLLHVIMKTWCIKNILNSSL